MPTLAEWDQALGTPRTVRVESSQALLNDVAQKQAKNDAYLAARNRPVPQRKPLSVVSEFDPDREITIAPLYLLHRLGVVTTPPVENLADICSTWAYFRYLWAFALPNGLQQQPLALSHHAKGIDFHQKGLLSDQVGVGMAAAIMELFLGAPLAADVDVAMNDPQWPIDLQFPTSPDYLFFDESHSNIFVVECKGTQSDRGAALDQIRRGTEQVPSLVFQDGRMPISLVVATQLSTSGTCVYVVDPPAEGNHEESPTSSKRISEREWTVRDAEKFARATRLISEAKVLAYAGSDAEAIAKLERANVGLGRMPRVQPREATIQEVEEGAFAGVVQALPTRDRVGVTIFQGIERDVREAYLDDDVQRLKHELATYRERIVGIDQGAAPGSHVRMERRAGGFSALSTSADGTMLKIEVQSR